MIGQLLPNTNEMLQCILAIQILDLNTAIVKFDGKLWDLNMAFVPYWSRCIHTHAWPIHCRVFIYRHRPAVKRQRQHLGLWSMWTPVISIDFALFTSQFLSQISLCKKRIFVTSKWRHMYGVLNIKLKTNYTILLYFATRIF
jgi:hypothetical protein